METDKNNNKENRSHEKHKIRELNRANLPEQKPSTKKDGQARLDMNHLEPPLNMAVREKQIQDEPADDGMFLKVVVVVTLGSMAVVLLVGYHLHRPSQPRRAGLPTSDSTSPTFQTAKL